MLFVDDFLFRMASRRVLKCLSRVLKHKKTVMCLMEKIPVLDKFGSGMSYHAFGGESSVNR